jgi:hypothetical protein
MAEFPPGTLVTWLGDRRRAVAWTLYVVLGPASVEVGYPACDISEACSALDFRRCRAARATELIPLAAFGMRIERPATPEDRRLLVVPDPALTPTARRLDGKPRTWGDEYRHRPRAMSDDAVRPHDDFRELLAAAYPIGERAA